MNSFSPNMLKTFNECPKKYYYKYVKKISVPQKESYFERGKKIHAIANYYLKGEDISKMEKILDKEDLILWERLKSNEFFNKQYLYSEYNLSCKIENFWINGRLDAIFREHDKYFILDYKTGSIPKNPEYDFQTMIYLIMADQFLEDYVSLSFVYLDLKKDINYEIVLTENLKNSYISQISNIVKEILKTQEYHTKTDNCRFCEYVKLCGLLR